MELLIKVALLIWNLIYTIRISKIKYNKFFEDSCIIFFTFFLRKEHE
jgi:hypothetical protein